MLRDRVKKEGKLLLTVPAYQYLWSQHDVVYHHKRRYSVSHLRRLLKESGWMLNYISYFNTFLFSLDLIDRIKQKIMPSQKYNQLNAPSGWLNQLLQTIFGLERHFIGSMAFPALINSIKYRR